MTDIGYNAVTGGLNGLLQPVKLFGRFCTSVQLILVKHVLFPCVRRREVGHHHIGACLQAPFPPVFGKRAQSGGGGQQHLGKEQA